MRYALRLAQRGRGRVEPNPLVGCVIVQGRRLVGRGYHRRFGGPHAEVEALRRCGRLARGATAYVTLEPCCHFGKTPPCTDALISAGVARVVAPLADPNPLVGGRGFAALRHAGVRVDVGLLAERAAALNAPFFKLVRTGLPWVILKWAQSLDGKIATRRGDSRWISDQQARRHAHRKRGLVDAIIVGVGTVLRDDPLLTCRYGRARRIAKRIILDSRLRTPPGAQLVRTARRVPTWIFHAPRPPSDRARSLERAGCRLWSVPGTRSGLSLRAILRVLGREQMTNVLVEGGGQVLGQFLDQQLADELCLYVGPLLVGGAAATGPWHTLGAARLTDALRLPPTARLRRLGSGYLLETGLPKR